MRGPDDRVACPPPTSLFTPPTFARLARCKSHSPGATHGGEGGMRARAARWGAPQLLSLCSPPTPTPTPQIGKQPQVNPCSCPSLFPCSGRAYFLCAHHVCACFLRSLLLLLFASVPPLACSWGLFELMNWRRSGVRFKYFQIIMLTDIAGVPQIRGFRWLSGASASTNDESLRELNSVRKALTCNVSPAAPTNS